MRIVNGFHRFGSFFVLKTFFCNTQGIVLKRSMVEKVYAPSLLNVALTFHKKLFGYDTKLTNNEHLFLQSSLCYSGSIIKNCQPLIRRKFKKVGLFVRVSSHGTKSHRPAYGYCCSFFHQKRLKRSVIRSVEKTPQRFL